MDLVVEGSSASAEGGDWNNDGDSWSVATLLRLVLWLTLFVGAAVCLARCTLQWRKNVCLDIETDPADLIDGGPQQLNHSHSHSHSHGHTD